MTDPDLIIEKASEILGLTTEMVKSRSRKTELTEARFICVHHILKANPKITTLALGKIFDRHHSTIIYMREIYDVLIKSDKEFNKKALKVHQLI